LKRGLDSICLPQAGRAGDVIITGSITPPLMIESDETGIGHAIDPIGEVSVSFTWG